MGYTLFSEVYAHDFDLNREGTHQRTRTLSCAPSRRGRRSLPASVVPGTEGLRGLEEAPWQMEEHRRAQGAGLPPPWPVPVGMGPADYR